MMLFFARLTNVGGEFLIFIRQNPNLIVSITVSQLYIALFSSFHIKVYVKKAFFKSANIMSFRPFRNTA